MNNSPDPRFENQESRFEILIQILQRHYGYDPKRPVWMVVQTVVAAAALVLVVYKYFGDLS